MENNEGNKLSSTQGIPDQNLGQQPVRRDSRQVHTSQQAQPVGEGQFRVRSQSQPQAFKTSGLAIAGMVLGIVALVLVFIPVANFAAPILAIVGLILSIVGLQGVNKGKASGKGIAIAGIVTCAVAALITLLVIVACSSYLGSLTSNNKSIFVGTWDVIEMTSDGRTYSEKEIESARKNGKDSFIVLENDGKAILVIGGERVDLTWEPADSSSLYLIAENGNKNLFKLEGNVLSTSGAKFRKGSPRSSIPEAKSSKSSSSASSSASSKSSSSSSASSSSSSSQVDPELKEFLDSYEAFADEYVAFMQEYKNSGYSASMMNKYLDLTQRYTDFANKVSSWEKKAKSMSAADAAYYAEVSARVSKKLLEAM